MWLFDLDNTLHDASLSAFSGITRGMSEYLVRELGVAPEEADALRRHYWLRYGATLLGVMRHHGVRMQHFLHHTHVLPGLEAQVRGHAHDLAAVARLPGRKYVLTNAPRAYTRRVLGALGVQRLFDGVISVEDMRMFGHVRPKPDARMLRRVVARLHVAAAHCVLVEDTLDHLKSARRLGMTTVWMQRFTRSAREGRALSRRVGITPAYVDHRVRRLRALECQCLPAPRCP